MWIGRMTLVGRKTEVVSYTYLEIVRVSSHHRAFGCEDRPKARVSIDLRHLLLGAERYLWKALTPNSSDPIK